MMPDAPRSCPERQRLMGKVQQHLIRIAELSHAAADALANGNENLVREVDSLVEHELGAKERALGALRQHREEHGC
jgi:phage shock protein A